MDTTEKTRENRLRRMAQRQGYRLMKSRSRDPRAIGFGEYMIVDLETNLTATGDPRRGEGLDLDGVEEWLTSDR
jgi:hypothetical protein